MLFSGFCDITFSSSSSYSVGHRQFSVRLFVRTCGVEDTELDSDVNLFGSDVEVNTNLCLSVGRNAYVCVCVCVCVCARARACVRACVCRPDAAYAVDCLSVCLSVCCHASLRPICWDGYEETFTCSASLSLSLYVSVSVPLCLCLCWFVFLSLFRSFSPFFLLFLSLSVCLSLRTLK